MLVIGIDPGTASTGYGVIRRREDGELELVDYGVIATPAGDPMPDRLRSLYQELSELLALGPEGCGDRCRLWSAEARPIDRFDRDTARRAWAVRTRLGADDRQRFDALPVAVQAQLAELYVEVLAAEPRVRAVEGLPEHRTTSLAAVNR